MKAKHAVWGYLAAVIIIPTLAVVVPIFKVPYWPSFDALFSLVSALKLLSVTLLVIKVIRHDRFKDFLES